MPNGTDAARLLLRFLKSEQARGRQRAFLSDEAKASLRELFFAGKAPRRTTVTAPAASTRAKSTTSPSPAPRQEPPKQPSPQVPSPSELTSTPKADPQPAAPEYSVAPSAVARTRLSPTGSDQVSQLQSLREQIAQDEIAHPRSLRDTMVFSVGNPHAEIMFIGEAPGHEEERLQEPFVGPAGQLLTKIIQAMGLQRESVYISNIVKFRPDTGPNQGRSNRKPDADEMAACLPYILAEIEIIQPKAIVALGATAAEGLTGEPTPVGRSRGRVRLWNEIPLVVTYHPSYLLHNQAHSERRKVWEDMLLVMEVLGMPISEKQRRFFSKQR